MTDQPLLGIYGICFSYFRNLVLEDVSLELRPGEILALIGPNGSGKSTLLKIAAGILPVGRRGLSGAVRYRGHDVQKKEPAWRARHLGYAGSDWKVDFPLTAHEAVMLGRLCQSSNDDEKIVQTAMHECCCWDLRERDLKTLSGGERQLVLLARVLAQGAKVLFLDESLSKMDLHHQAKIGALLASLADQGFAVVWVSHDLNLVSEWATTCLFLKRGRKIAAGSFQSVFTEQNLDVLYPSAPIRVGVNPVTGKPKVFFRGQLAECKVGG